MTHTILIANQKGGVGKTTTAIALADELSRQGGNGHANQVLLIDLDTQGQVAPSLGIDRSSAAYHLLSEGTLGFGMRMARPNLHVLPGSTQTALYKITDTLKLRRDLENKKGLLDYIIIDTGPGLSKLNIAAIFAADRILIPTTLDGMGIDGLVQFVRSIQQARHQGATAQLSWVVPTFHEKITKETERLLTLLVQKFQNLVTIPIPDDVRAREAPGRGLTISEHAPRCRAAKAYRALADRVLADLNGDR